MEQVERLSFQLEHLEQTGEVLPTLAPYVEAVRISNPGLFGYANEDAENKGQGSSEDVMQEQINKVISSLGVIAPSEKLLAQIRHYLMTGEVYETLGTLQNQVNGIQRKEAEAQVYEFEQQSNSTHAQEVSMEQNFVSDDLFSISVF